MIAFFNFTRRLQTPKDNLLKDQFIPMIAFEQKEYNDCFDCYDC